MNTPMTLGYARELAEARSCLAALADTSPYERSIAYEHLLLDLDAMHGGDGPATFPIAGSPLALHRRLEARLEDLSEIGADPLRIELLLAGLDEIRLTAERGLRGEGAIGRQQAHHLPHRLAHIRHRKKWIRLTGGPLVASSALERSRRVRTQTDQCDPSAPVADRQPTSRDRGVTMNDIEPNEDGFVPTLLLRVEEAALRLGIGRTSMYRLVMTGEVESVQIGGLRRIPAPCLEEFIERLRHGEPAPVA